MANKKIEMLYVICHEGSANSNSREMPLTLTVCMGSVTQACPTLCDPVDCSPPGSSVHGILQARILEWVAIPFSSEPS